MIQSPPLNTFIICMCIFEWQKIVVYICNFLIARIGIKNAKAAAPANILWCTMSLNFSSGKTKSFGGVLLYENHELIHTCTRPNSVC